MRSPDGVIRITPEEVHSAHVDDLIKRQMSLRGDPGVTRGPGRRWYYQNWFVFMIVGTLGALAAWAVLEPVYDDFLYVQGEIVSWDDRARGLGPSGKRDYDVEFSELDGGLLTIGEDTIVVPEGVRQVLPDGTMGDLEALDFTEGDEIGVYVTFAWAGEQAFPLAAYIDLNPEPQGPEVAEANLEQLSAQDRSASILVFPTVAAAIGLLIGAVDGLICRLPRRALLCGGVGLAVGFVGGLVCSMFAGLVYTPLSELANRQWNSDSSMLSSMGFAVQITGRGLAWSVAGLAMGLGQGIALRSSRLTIYGLLGGVLGGLLGGLLFDPIDLILLGEEHLSAHWSRLVGFMVIGASVGALIGLVELLARDAWLRMTQGPLTGKEFLVFKEIMNLGSSPRSDIYLFNDPLVAENHAVLRAAGEGCEIQARQATHPVLLNNRPVQRARLRHGDNVMIGRTAFVFQERKG